MSFLSAISPSGKEISCRSLKPERTTIKVLSARCENSKMSETNRQGEESMITYSYASFNWSMISFKRGFDSMVVGFGGMLPLIKRSNL